jgi:large subunit ribosomal protein L17
LRWWAEHVVTLAKRGDVASRRQIITLLGCTETQRNKENRVRSAIDRIYTHLVPRFQTRNGGYTQILKLVKRRAGDNADMVVMRYLPENDDKKTAKKTKGSGSGEKKKAAPGGDKGSKKLAAGSEKKPREKKAPEDKASKKKETEKKAPPEDK